MIPQKLISKCQCDYVTEVWHQKPQVRFVHLRLLASDFCDVIRLTSLNQLLGPHIILTRYDSEVKWHGVGHFWFAICLSALFRSLKDRRNPLQRFAVCDYTLLLRVRGTYSVLEEEVAKKILKTTQIESFLNKYIWFYIVWFASVGFDLLQLFMQYQLFI